MRKSPAKFVVSVLITFYRQDDYIENAIRSALDLLKKSCTNGEVLVCVQDPSERAIAELKRFGKNIRYFISKTKENLIPLSNASFNRMFLLSRTNSDYAIFLDGDDWYSGSLRNAINILNNDLSIGGVAHLHSIYDARTNKVVEHKTEYKDGELLTYSKQIKNYLHGNAILFRTSIDFKPLENFLNDTTLIFYLIEKSKVMFSNKNQPLMVYRIGIPSIYTSREYSEKLLNQLIVQNNNLNILYKHRKDVLLKILTILSDILNNGLPDNYELFLKQASRQNYWITKTLLKILISRNALLINLLKIFIKNLLNLSKK